MKFKFAVLTVLMCVSAAMANASVIFQGTFSSDNQVELFSFTSDGVNPVTLQSLGYAGGTAGTTTVSAGGFAPNFIVFDSTGGQVATDQGGHCGTTNPDPTTGNCNDPFISQIFGSGNYSLALLVWDNVSFDGMLADGFKQDGNPGFTCSENGVSGNFCDVTYPLYESRTGNYALTIDGASAASDLSNPTGSAPEPATLFLFFTGALGVALFQARSRLMSKLQPLSRTAARKSNS
jgi:hypothetical protein